ncbi:Methionine aminopeptidase [Gryllus bimaculatus]|nr:Methionine aminopeptidase [Gryllus bimaculatus]
MRRTCRLARRLLDELRPLAKVGTTTAQLNDELWRQAINAGAYPSPLNYRGFPRSICTSVNNVAVHGIPDNRPLCDGDIVTVDVTVYFDGVHGDCADTFLIGNVDEPGQALVKAAYMCRDAGISVCKSGVPFSAIGGAIENAAAISKVTVVPAFVGHGIGSYFHGPPDIYHFAHGFPGMMEEGMTFTIEPVVAQGTEEVVILEDGWTAVMLDDGRAAQAEHTVLITENGFEILTQ